MINADSDECFVCRNDIKENENNATCESCDKHFHVSCIYKSDDKLADQRLIWICYVAITTLLIECLIEYVSHLIITDINHLMTCFKTKTLSAPNRSSTIGQTHNLADQRRGMLRTEKNQCVPTKTSENNMKQVHVTDLNLIL